MILICFVALTGWLTAFWVEHATARKTRYTSRPAVLGMMSLQMRRQRKTLSAAIKSILQSANRQQWQIIPSPVLTDPLMPILSPMLRGMVSAMLETSLQQKTRLPSFCLMASTFENSTSDGIGFFSWPCKIGEQANAIH